jgi:hypothetical protein
MQQAFSVNHTGFSVQRNRRGPSRWPELPWGGDRNPESNREESEQNQYNDVSNW